MMKVAAHKQVRRPRGGWYWDRYEMDDGRVFLIDHRGWILGENGEPTAHPEVDRVMAAIIAFEAEPIV
jgi:hypothetical protein